MSSLHRRVKSLRHLTNKSIRAVAMLVAGLCSEQQIKVLCSMCSHVGLTAGAACQCTEGSAGACGPGNVSAQSVPDGPHVAPLALRSHANLSKQKHWIMLSAPCTILDAYPEIQQRSGSATTMRSTCGTAPCVNASGVMSCVGRSMGRLHLLSTGLDGPSDLTCLQARCHWSE